MTTIKSVGLGVSVPPACCFLKFRGKKLQGHHRGWHRWGWRSHRRSTSVSSCLPKVHAGCAACLQDGLGAAVVRWPRDGRKHSCSHTCSSPSSWSDDTEAFWTCLEREDTEPFSDSVWQLHLCAEWYLQPAAAQAVSWLRPGPAWLSLSKDS